MSGNVVAIKFMNLIYENYSFCLKRKREKFLSATEQINKRINKNYRGVKVMQFTLDGKFVNMFESYKNAAAKIGTNYQNIRSCAIGKTKTSCGYKWKI